MALATVTFLGVRSPEIVTEEISHESEGPITISAEDEVPIGSKYICTLEPAFYVKTCGRQIEADNDVYFAVDIISGEGPPKGDGWAKVTAVHWG